MPLFFTSPKNIMIFTFRKFFMDTTFDIFSLPPIVLEKVQLSAVLELVRKRVNKGYMPSSYGKVEYNSKPEYTEHANDQFPHFPRICESDWTGYYCLTDFVDSSRKPIFFNLRTDMFQIVINLQTTETIIRRCVNGRGIFVEWKDDEEQTIPLKMHEVKEWIDMYG